MRCSQPLAALMPRFTLRKHVHSKSCSLSPAVADLILVRQLASRTLNLCLPKLVTVRMLGPYPTDADGVARITKADSTEFFPIAPPDHARKVCGGRRPPLQL